MDHQHQGCSEAAVRSACRSHVWYFSQEDLTHRSYCLLMAEAICYQLELCTTVVAIIQPCTDTALGIRMAAWIALAIASC